MLTPHHNAEKFRGGPAGCRDRLASLAGAGAPKPPLRYQRCVTAGKKADSSRIKTQALLCFSLTALCRLPLTLNNRGAAFVWTHTRSQKATQVCCLISSIACLHGMLFTQSFGSVFALLPGRCLCIDITGLFLGSTLNIHNAVDRRVDLKVNPALIIMQP